MADGAMSLSRRRRQGMGKGLNALADSAPAQAAVTVAFYAFYGAVLGLCLFPPAAALRLAWTAAFPPNGGFTYLGMLLFCMGLGGAVFVFAVSGAVIMGLTIRVLRLGIAPGDYPAHSPTMVRWLLYSGVYSLALALVLPLIPMSFFSNLFFALIGCRMGKRVRLNSFKLNDAYLIELGDDVTIGGQADISPHLFQNGKLTLRRIKIGSGSLIGAKAYIAPGVTIGQRCLIGLGSYIRPNARIPDDTHYASLGGMPMRKVVDIEKN
jgi:acetyltransferase-like isoleucine patch superfamily enzyme